MRPLGKRIARRPLQECERACPLGHPRQAGPVAASLGLAKQFARIGLVIERRIACDYAMTGQGNVVKEMLSEKLRRSARKGAMRILPPGAGGYAGHFLFAGKGIGGTHAAASIEMRRARNASGAASAVERRFLGDLHM